MGCLPPDPFVCVRVRAGCVREKEETASGAHAATKHGNIFKLYVYPLIYLKKRDPTYYLIKVRPELVSLGRV